MHLRERPHPASGHLGRWFSQSPGMMLIERNGGQSKLSGRGACHVIEIKNYRVAATSSKKLKVATTSLPSHPPHFSFPIVACIASNWCIASRSRSVICMPYREGAASLFVVQNLSRKDLAWGERYTTGGGQWGEIAMYSFWGGKRDTAWRERYRDTASGVRRARGRERAGFG